MPAALKPTLVVFIDILPTAKAGGFTLSFDKDGDHTVFEVSYKRKGHRQQYAFVVGDANGG